MQSRLILCLSITTFILFKVISHYSRSNASKLFYLIVTYFKIIFKNISKCLKKFESLFKSKVTVTSKKTLINESEHNTTYHSLNKHQMEQYHMH